MTRHLRTGTQGTRRGPRALFPLVLGAAVAPGVPSCNSGESLLRAKQIETRFEVVGGPVSVADVGDYLLENDQIRVAILGARDSPAPGVFGGSIVDVDLRRRRLGFEDGQGHDRFAETFPLANLLVPDPTPRDIRVLKDGSDGEEAIIRVEGDGQFLFEALSILRSQNEGLKLYYPGIRSTMRLRTDYVLHPGDRHVIIRTTLLLGDDVEGCAPLTGCDVPCDLGHKQDASGCLTCACNDPVPLEMATEPISIFGTVLGDLTGDGTTPVRRAGIVAGDFVFFGNQNDVFAPGPGFDEDAAVQDAANAGRNSFERPLSFDFVAAAGGDISYGYFTVGPSGGPPPVVNVPLFASAATSFLAAQKSCLFDEADDEACDNERAFTYERYLAVGDGDIDSVTREIYRVRGSATGTVSGHVLWRDTAEPSANAQVFVFLDPDKGRTWTSASELAEENRAKRGDVGVVSAIDADVGLDLTEDGDFSGTLPPGDYVLVARNAEKTATSVPEKVHVGAGDHVELPLLLPTPATVQYRVTDETGTLIPAKLSFVSLDKDGAPLEGDGLRKPYLGEGRLGGGERLLETTAGGEGEIRIEPGRYRVTVSRGIEYGIFTEGPFEIHGGDVRRIDATVPREIDTTGWMSTDMHLHSKPSFDSGMPLPKRVTAVAAEGVELAVSTDHDVETDYRPTVRQLGLAPSLATAVGAEITTLEQGHFIGFPLKYDELDVPSHGAHDWTCEGGGAILDAIRRSGDGKDAFTIVAHPRDGFFGYVDQLGVDTFTMNRTSTKLEENNPVFRTASCDFDAMELFNQKRIDLIRTPTVAEVTEWNRCLARLEASTTIAEMNASCPELGAAPLAPCSAAERFPACKSRYRTRLAWLTLKRILVRTPEEQDASFLFPGNTFDSQALCDPKKLGAGPVPAEIADEPCTYRAGHLDDYFRYLEHGMIRTQIGSSDSHGPNNEPGMPRTYFQSKTDSPAALSVDAATEALREGHATPTYGPFIRASIDGRTYGEIASAKAGQKVDLLLDVQTASWFGVDRVEVYMNGRIVKVLSPGVHPSAIQDVHGKVTLDVPARDSWVVVVAMGVEDADLMHPIAHDVPFGEIQLSEVASDAFGKIPIVDQLFSAPPTIPGWSPIPAYAATNAIYIDTGGDGAYDAPLPPPDWCSRPCNPSSADPTQCPEKQTCLEDEKVCGFVIGGKCDHRRLAPGHSD